MSRRPFLILKIGGSLFSDKKQDWHIDTDAVRKFARLVAELNQHAPGRMALVVGGGSFGHGAVRRANAADRFGILDLTKANFEQKWIWTEALRAEGCLAIPLQLTAMCGFDGDELRVDGGVLQRALAAGVLPVLSGDCLLGLDGLLRVFGSDRVPQVLLRIVEWPVRVVALTDTSGVFRAGTDPQVLRHVDPDLEEEVSRNVWNTSYYDTTGGMKGKLQAFFELSRQGAECFVMKGDADDRSLLFLLDQPQDWPAEMVYTRICQQ